MPGDCLPVSPEYEFFMLFQHDDKKRFPVSRTDASNPLSSYAPFAFELDGAQWPTVEHYYQAMKFEDAAYREAIRSAATPKEAAKLGKNRLRKRRKDWKNNTVIYMTRGSYIKCRQYPEVAAALMESGDTEIAELNSYDYFWGSGRDMRGHNHFGKLWMGIRQKLREELAKG